MSGLQSCVDSIQSSIPLNKKNDEQILEEPDANYADEMSEEKKFAIEELSLLLEEMAEWITQTTVSDSEEKLDTDKEKATEKTIEENDGVKVDENEQSEEKEQDETEIKENKEIEPESTELEPKSDENEDLSSRKEVVNVSTKEWKLKVVEMNIKLQEWVQRVGLIIERCEALQPVLSLHDCLVEL